MSSELKRVYGIDLGTTYSCIAVVDEIGKAVVLRNSENHPITPSVVFFDGDRIIVGEEAKKHSRLYPLDVVEMVKRSMGDANYLFTHIQSGKTYRAEEISSYILRKIVGDVEQSTGEKVTDVVITCPAYFGINEREATANAGKIIGLNVLTVINEPTAAAISYGMDKADNQVVLVYDLGGGTFDITMIEIKSKEIRVICTGGDHDLGGKNWDSDIVKYLAEQYCNEHGAADLMDDPETLQDMLLQAEGAKKTLTLRDRARIKVTHAGKSTGVELTREKFDEITNHWLESTVRLTHEMLADAAKKGHERFDKILLVGGSTRMPQVMERLTKEFSVACEMFDPDESVAKGAAIYGWKLALDEEIKTSVAEQTGQSVSEIDLSRVDAKILNRAQQQVVSEFAIPASGQKVMGTKFQEVTPKTFGVVVLDEQRVERVANLIIRNSDVPTEKSGRFGTETVNQSTAEVRLMENLSLEKTSEIDQSTEIGRAELQLPPGLPAGSPIEVLFRLNLQGRLEAEAVEPNSKQKVNIVVETACVMSKVEVEEAKSRALTMNIS